jgi:arylsulfatase
VARLLALALLAAGCGSGEEEELPEPRAGRRDVLLVVVDTLRADHLGCYGYGRPTSPVIDRLASEGALFERVVSASAFTGPAVASIHTGRYPRCHSFGVANGSFLLAPEEETVAERFRAAGYRTGAVVCNPVLPRRLGFDQGFETYDHRMQQREKVRNAPERVAAPATDAAIAWLEGLAADEPFFLWVHYMDPHGPYTPPPELEAAFAPEEPGPAIPPPPAKGANNGKGFVPWYQAVREEHHLFEYVGRYDGEIAYMDRELGRLFDALRAMGRYEDTLIVLTSDHGEALGEGGYYFCHGQHPTPDQSFVPMIVKHPLAPAGARVGSAAGHVDVYRTLTAELGEAHGERWFEDALDLVLAARSAPPSRPLYCDLGRELGVYVDDLVLTAAVAGGEAGAAGPEDLRHPQLARRPGSDGAPANARPDVEAALTELGRNYLRQTPRGRTRLDGDDDLREALEALGYAGE